MGQPDTSKPSVTDAVGSLMARITLLPAELLGALTEVRTKLRRDNMCHLFKKSR